MSTATQLCDDEMNGSLPNKRTLVAGLGTTGLAAARFLASQGEEVLVIDSRANPPGLEALRAAQPELQVVLGSLHPRWLEGVSQVVISPGLGLDIGIAAEARRCGIPLVSEIELFARAVHAPVVAVTGSNGKSTVVTLVERMLAAAGVRVAAGGNLGPAAVDLLSDQPEVYVLELSSFQLETTRSLRPGAAAVLNVSADHLDRHGSLERYAAVKARLLRAARVPVFNWDDPIVRAMGAEYPGGIPFSAREYLDRGYCASPHRGERWLFRDARPVLPTSRLRIPGRHNESNALAALALADMVVSGLSASAQARSMDALCKFPGLEHRCQWVAEEDGIAFINDSKGTNVGATVAALRGLPGPLVLIAGGRAKGADFGTLAEAAAGRVAGAVVMGEAGGALQQALSPVTSVVGADDMPSAVGRAVELARAAGFRQVTVLLSPACASFDMFSDYEARGDAFVAAVEARQR